MPSVLSMWYLNLYEPAHLNHGQKNDKLPPMKSNAFAPFQILDWNLPGCGFWSISRDKVLSGVSHSCVLGDPDELIAVIPWQNVGQMRVWAGTEPLLIIWEMLLFPSLFTAPSATALQPRRSKAHIGVACFKPEPCLDFLQSWASYQKIGLYENGKVLQFLQISVWDNIRQLADTK